MTPPAEPDPTVVSARPELGGGSATPSRRLPSGAASGLPGAPAPLRIGGRRFAWGERTFVMGILNVTPDSFSGDGLLAASDPVAAAVDQARRMVDEGADLLDVGGESTRPGHALVDPGFGFGKTADHNVALLRDLAALRVLGRPILLGASRKSTLGKVLDLPGDERLEATLATTALAAAAGVDIVRVHDVRENVRAARMADAVVRGAPRL